MSRRGLFTKDQLARPYGLSSDTIDFYVANDLLRPIFLHDGIFYTSSDFLRIEIIEKGKRLGLALQEIKLLISSAETRNQTPSSGSD